MHRSTPSNARRREQRRTKQEQHAESQKLKSECMEYKTKDDTIQKLQQDNIMMTATLEDKKLQKGKSILSQKQLKK